MNLAPLLPSLPDVALLGIDRCLSVAPAMTFGMRLDVWIEQHKRATIREVTAPDERPAWPRLLGV